MDDLELIFSMLGERVSTEITQNEDKQGFDECEDAAKRGGKLAGNARIDTEKELKRSISTKKNYLEEPENLLTNDDKDPIEQPEKDLKEGRTRKL